MFFILSKIFEFFTAPTNLALFVGALGVALSFTRYQKAGYRLSGGVILFLLLVGFSPISLLLALPLETRFPPLATDTPAPDGIIVLGGMLDERSSSRHNQPVLNDAAERLTEAVRLRRLYPHARLVFTGGSAALRGSLHTEAEHVQKFWNDLGVDQNGVIYEDRSRNTFENAIFTRDLVKPGPKERWLLVTSATHMPRSVGIFRKAGFNVIADPVDYRTTGMAHDWSLNLRASDNFVLTEVAVHEWIGLVAYWMTGKTDELFPGP